MSSKRQTNTDAKGGTGQMMQRVQLQTQTCRTMRSAHRKPRFNLSSSPLQKNKVANKQNSLFQHKSQAPFSHKIKDQGTGVVTATRHAPVESTRGSTRDQSAGSYSSATATKISPECSVAESGAGIKGWPDRD